MALPVKRICVVSPVQFIVHVNTQTLIRADSLDAHSPDVHWADWILTSAVQIDQQLLGFIGIELEMVIPSFICKLMQGSFFVV